MGAPSPAPPGIDWRRGGHGGPGGAAAAPERLPPPNKGGPVNWRCACVIRETPGSEWTAINKSKLHLWQFSLYRKDKKYQIQLFGWNSKVSVSVTVFDIWCLRFGVLLLCIWKVLVYGGNWNRMSGRFIRHGCNKVWK